MCLTKGLFKAFAMCLGITLADGCLHGYAKDSVEASAGQNVLLHFGFYLKYNYTLDNIYIYWGKEIGEDLYEVLVVFDGRDLRISRQGALPSVVGLMSGNASLLLNNVTNSDAGPYLCDVTMTTAEKGKKTIVNRKLKTHLDIIYANTYKRGFYGVIFSVVFLMFGSVVLTMAVFYIRSRQAREQILSRG